MDNTKVEAEIERVSALENLKRKVKLRDSMGGSLYYNVTNEECCQLANKCLSIGCDKSEIESILGQGTFTN